MLIACIRNVASGVAVSVEAAEVPFKVKALKVWFGVLRDESS